MKCPDCGEKLDEMKPPGGEYACNNKECPANIELKKTLCGRSGRVEYIGCSQKEINAQRRIKKSKDNHQKKVDE